MDRNPDFAKDVIITVWAILRALRTLPYAIGATASIESFRAILRETETVIETEMGI